jgi:hypothetical protein
VILRSVGRHGLVVVHRNGLVIHIQFD